VGVGGSGVARDGAGVPSAELRRLVDYWRGGYDWREHERAINALPSHLADIDGTAVHYVRLEGEHPDALPIVLTHGWPSSFLELVGLGRRLARPSEYGGRAEESFTVIIPSLPGFAFSPQRPELPAVPTHELWHRLMHDVLGFERYGAHGGDLGAGVSSRLAAAHPESVVGVHVLAVGDPGEVDAASLTPADQAYRDQQAEWYARDGGYEHEQRTRPLTLAYGLADSPVGLLAWLLEKYTAWTDGDGLPPAFDDDFVLTQVSLYWFTGTISTSFRPYWEHARFGSPGPRVTVPTGVAVFPADLVQPPRSWAETTHEVVRYTRMPRGGHFAALEVPELLAEEVREFFAALR
ncbi:epoxide hydrolase family protein, partial [Subtercola sp. Z020]|uniref:epoxide hydrolase family protein n=1 Tax=Subtercola sp. Z020 TaxID=2080582 RepID=UPI0018ECE1DC